MARVTRAQAVQACREDINYLRRICSPEYPDDFPPLYVAVFLIITKNIHDPEVWTKFVVALPRGHLKTTFLELISVWVITFTTMTSFLIVANTRKLSRGILASVTDLMSSSDYITLFGLWSDGHYINNQEEKELHFLDRHIRIATTYRLGPVRGDKRVERFQFMLIDDVFSLEQSESDSEFNKTIRWLQSTLFKARNKKRCIIVYGGNRYPNKNCIVSLYANQSTWVSVMVGCIQPDGTALMPHVMSLEQLLAEYREDCDMGMEDSFLAEMMNGTSSGVVGGMDFSKLPPAIPEDRELHMLPFGRAIILDPATDKDTPDQIAIGVVDMYPDGRGIFTTIETSKDSYDMVADRVVTLALTFQVPLIVYEDVAFQHIMKRAISKRLEDLGIYSIEVLPVSSRGIRKNTRIRYDCFKKILPYKDTETLEEVEPTVRFSPQAREKVLSNLQGFNPAKTNNVDDVIDMVAYYQHILRDPKLLAAATLSLNMEVLPEAPVIT